MQSACFDDLFYQNANLVISAPTASGKTALLELAICRLFDQQSQSRQRELDIKVLYLAPLRILCAEKASEWQSKFSACGLQCTKVVGGDLSGTDPSSSPASDTASILKSHIICATPEKWLSIIRSTNAGTRLSLLRAICLVLIDECHTVGSSRGAALEIATMQIRCASPSARFIATSATVGNIGDVAEWLSTAIDDNAKCGTPTAAKTLVFGEEYRPVPLTKVALGYPCNAPYYQFQRNLDFKLPDIINSHCSGRSTIIFCSSRNSAQDTCRFLARNINRLARRPMPMCLTSPFTNGLLNDAVPAGVAFHHAGLSASDRNRVEMLFTSGSIQILCSTSTLGIGVNLPAYAVVIKGTKGYVDNEYVEYSFADILQFIGRAGRPQFGPSGKAIVLTDAAMVDTYRRLVLGSDMLESSLGPELPRHVLAGLDKGIFLTVDDVIRWMGFSFLAVRARKQPAKYGVPCSGIQLPLVHKDVCAALVNQVIERLSQARLVNRQQQRPPRGLLSDTASVTVTMTVTGSCIAKHEVDPMRMSRMLADERLPPGPTYEHLLRIVCGCGEFDSLRIATGQKSVLNEMNKGQFLHARVQNRVQTVYDKVLILVQYGLHCRPIPSGKYAAGLNQDINRALRIAYGPAACIRDHYAERRDVQGTVNATRLCRELAGRCSEQSCSVLQQISGVGPRYAEMLWNGGIKTIVALRKTLARNIEYMLGRNPPFGTRVLSNVAGIPNLVVNVESFWVNERSVVLAVKVQCGAFKSRLQQCDARRMDRFTILVYTSDNLLLKFDSVALDSLEAYYDTQVGLCNPTPNSSIIIEVSPEQYAGCAEVLKVDIPDYDLEEPASSRDSELRQDVGDNAIGSDSDLEKYDDLMDDLLTSSESGCILDLTNPFE
ncbi:ATP-dependent DNA helicase MER3 [Coemansia sp. Benny D115]|nr:ATP-dependent DNA helicase MER3 [Coemansia sp. Benny D115]